MPLCDGEHKKFPGYVKPIKSPPVEASNGDNSVTSAEASSVIDTPTKTS